MLHNIYFKRTTTSLQPHTAHAVASNVQLTGWNVDIIVRREVDSRLLIIT